MKVIKLLLTIIKWLIFITAAPLIGFWALVSFIGVIQVLAGQGDVEAWSGVFASLLILSVALVVVSVRIIRLMSKR
jgi:hypothetical protein